MKRFWCLLLTFVAIFAFGPASAQGWFPLIQNPSWSLDFTGGTLPGGATFTGPAAAAYHASSGNLSFSTLNTPRFDYDPVALTLKGLLYEPIQSTNTTLQSPGFSNFTILTNATRTENAVTGPDGTTSAMALKETTGAGNHIAAPTASITKQVSATAQQATTIVYVKSGVGTRNFELQVADGGFAGVGNVSVNLAACSISVAAAVTGTFTSPFAAASLDANGYCRVALSVVTNTVNTFVTQLVMLSGTSNSYTGDGSSTLDFYGLDVDFSPHFLSNSLVKTAGAAATRTVDTLTLNVPTGQNAITVTFDDGSTQSFIMANGNQPVPPLNRPWIKRIDGRPYTSPAAPALCSAAGFTVATLNQTFGSLSTIDLANTLAPGFPWYVRPFGFGGQVFGAPPAADYTIVGGNLNMTQSGAGEDSITTNGYVGQLGTREVGTLLRAGGCFEAKVAFNIASYVTGGQTAALWMADTGYQYMQQDNSLRADTGGGCEIDIMEPLAGSNGAPIAFTSFHDWTTVHLNTINTNNSLSGRFTLDSLPHVYDVVWKTSAQNAGTGSVQWYVDGTLYTTCTYTSGGIPSCNGGAGSGTFSICDSSWMFFQSHSAQTTPMTVYYKQAWQ